MAFEHKYTDEVRTASVAEVFRRREAEPRNRSIIREVAEEFEVGPQSLRKWVARYDDGSYSYDGAAAAPVTKQRLLERVAELEQHVAMLEEDNRSLTRVVTLLADQIRVDAH